MLSHQHLDQPLPLLLPRILLCLLGLGLAGQQDELVDEFGDVLSELVAHGVDLAIDGPEVVLKKGSAKCECEVCPAPPDVELYEVIEELEERLAVDVVQLDVPKKAADHHIPEYLLQHNIHLHLYVILPPVFLPRLHLVQHLLGDTGEEGDFGLDEVIVEHTAHGLSLHLPLIILAQQQSTPQHCLHGHHEE